MRLRPNMIEYALWPSLAQPEPDDYPTIIGAVDGDTIRIFWPYPIQMLDGVRLLEMDAPERGHNGWSESRVKLGQILHDQPVRYTSPWYDPVRRGRYGRILAYARTPHDDVGRLMIEQGYAWPYVKFGLGPWADAYATAFTQARDERNGLWQKMDPPTDPSHKRSPRVRPRPWPGQRPVCQHH